MRIPLGDAKLIVALEIPGLRRYRVRMHVGVATDTAPEDRVVNMDHVDTCASRKADLLMDLQADKKVALSVEWTDEVGNPVETPADATATFTVDDPTIINLTDNGDGTASAAATGTLGTANVHLTASAAGTTVTGDLQIVVVAGLAERATIVPGEVTEVTEDEPAPTP